MILFFHATLWNSEQEPETTIIIDAKDEKGAKHRVNFLNTLSPEGSKWNFDGPFPIDRTIILDELIVLETACAWWTMFMFTDGMREWAAGIIAHRAQRDWLKYIKLKGAIVSQSGMMTKEDRKRLESEYKSTMNVVK